MYAEERCLRVPDCITRSIHTAETDANLRPNEGYFLTRAMKSACPRVIYIYIRIIHKYIHTNDFVYQEIC